MNAIKYIISKCKLGRKKRIHKEWWSRYRTLIPLLGELGYKVGAEIGVQRGVYSKAILKDNPDIKLYCIDAWETYTPYKGAVDQKLMDFWYRDTKRRLSAFNAEIIKDWSMNAVKKFADESLDFVFIDANHSYDYVKEDISEWSKKVRKGGIVAGHDYVNGLHMNLGGGKTEYGVEKAVNEWIEEKKIKHLFVCQRDQESRSWFYVK